MSPEDLLPIDRFTNQRKMTPKQPRGQGGQGGQGNKFQKGNFGNRGGNFGNRGGNRPGNFQQGGSFKKTFGGKR